MIPKSVFRFLFHCFSPTTDSIDSASVITKPSSAAAKKRLSTSLRDDIPLTPNLRRQDQFFSEDDDDDEEQELETTSFFSGFVSSSTPTAASAAAQPRPSRSMVIGTIFGHRRGHVWFCVQSHRLSPRPLLLLELPILTHLLVAEMRSGLVRLALETFSASDRPDFRRRPLRSSPIWTAYLNGRRLGGLAARRRAGEGVRSVLRTMQSTTVGAGVIPAGGDGFEEVMYMRANYEHFVGNANSESFHLINPDESCQSQELSVFLLRSSRNHR